MRPAPALVVALPCGRSERWVVAVAWAAAAAASTAWIMAEFVPMAADALSPVLVASAAFVAALLAAFAALRRGLPARRHLRFDGSRWWLEPAQEVGQPAATPGPTASADDVDVMIDLGHWMLLRLRPAGEPVCWFGVGKAEAGAAWPRLRTTLYMYRTSKPGQTAVGR